MEKTFEQRVNEAKAAVSAVSPKEANELKLQNRDILFIDPRDEADIKSTTGIIPGALNVRLSDLSNTSYDELPVELSSRSREIITACQGGPMGALAAHELKKRGYHNVHFVDGGTQGWLDAGYSTVQ